MNVSSSLPSSALRRRTALVLGGGGSTGNAWLIGVVAGLIEAGLDVTDADLTIGTSAGATAAAQLTGATPARLLGDILSARASSPANRSSRASTSAAPVVNHLERTQRVIDSAADVADMRKRMGAAALERAAASDGSWQAQWRSIVASRLPDQRWPERATLITAVNAATGEPAVFDRQSGVDLVDAVAASCSSGIPFQIGDEQYIDGGYRTNAENADLATGYERVLVLSPFGGRSLVPERWGVHLATQVAGLRALGSRVETVFPSADSEYLFGTNGMDLSLRPAAARAGRDQGEALAEQLATFWNGPVGDDSGETGAS